MKVAVGKSGLDKTFQDNFSATCKCDYCGGQARIAFVAHELDNKPNSGDAVCRLHDNGGKGDFWVHDWGAWAVYMCRACAKATCLYNQG